MSDVQTGTIETRIPGRLDRLPWSRWHWLVVLGLGTVWIVDGLIPARVRGRADLIINGSAARSSRWRPGPCLRVTIGDVARPLTAEEADTPA